MLRSRSNHGLAAENPQQYTAVYRGSLRDTNATSQSDFEPPAAQLEDLQHPRGHLSPAKKTKAALLWMYYRAVAATNSRRLRACVSALLLIFLVLWLLRTPARISEKENRQQSYAVYIDGGSSGTRVHVFEYRHSLWPAYVQLNLPEKIFSVEPGLSSYTGHPEQAAAALQPLLEFAYREVPERLWSSTPVHLMTTAGLRLLRPADADAILQHCTHLLSSSRFLFMPRWARIINGDDEGLYAWAAANYVSGALEDASHQHHSRKEVLEVKTQPSRFNGVLELGGASFQITFMPSLPDSTLQHSGLTVPLPGITRPLFTHSYLGLGMDAALSKGASVVLSRHSNLAAGQHDQQQQQQQRQQGAVGGRRLGQWDRAAKALDLLDPCLPVGYQEQDGRKGSGDFDGCMQVVQQVLPPRVCTSSSSSSLLSSASLSSIGSPPSTGGHSTRGGTLSAAASSSSSSSSRIGSGFHSKFNSKFNSSSKKHEDAAAHGGWMKDSIGLGGSIKGSKYANSKGGDDKSSYSKSSSSSKHILEAARSGDQAPSDRQPQSGQKLLQNEQQPHDERQHQQQAKQLCPESGQQHQKQLLHNERQNQQHQQPPHTGQQDCQSRQVEQQQGEQQNEQGVSGSRVLLLLLGGKKAVTKTPLEMCTMEGVYVPPVTGINFLAIENLFWTARALGLPPVATLAEVQDAGKLHCALPWAELHHSFAGHVPHKYITRYCFGAAYVVALLHERLGVGLHDRTLHFTNSISRPVQSFDWGQEEAEEHHDENEGDGTDRDATSTGGSQGADGSRRLSKLEATGSTKLATGGTWGSSNTERGVELGGSRGGRGAPRDEGEGHRGSGPPTVAVGLSWVVGAMVVETMKGHHKHHPAFLFEGGFSEFEHGMGQWVQHHMVMSWAAGCALAVMFGWRCWRGFRGRRPRRF